jgi:hypothetical protein
MVDLQSIVWVKLSFGWTPCSGDGECVVFVRRLDEKLKLEICTPYFFLRWRWRDGRKVNNLKTRTVIGGDKMIVSQLINVHT